MTLFDVLDHSNSIRGPLFLEASAGTGKTFAIEHIVSRLVHQEHLPLESILVVTFTNAASLDLKERISRRLRLDGTFGYLESASIYTIHSFCALSLENAIEEEGRSRWKKVFLEILRTFLPYQQFGPLQVKKHLLLGLEPFLSYLIAKIHHPFPFLSFEEGFSQFCELVKTLDLKELYLLCAQFKGTYNRKKELHPEWAATLEQLQNPTKPFFDTLLAKKNLFDLLETNNCKKEHVVFLQKEIRLIKELLSTLSQKDLIASGFIECAKRRFSDLPKTFDDLLLDMEKKLEEPQFCERISMKYRAVIIDEFQDTDQHQWSILSKLFLQKSHIVTFAIVADPKQSIYRFRKADLNVFFQATQELTQGEKKILGKSYRSHPKLIEALNFLFSKKKDWLRFTDYQAVLPGREDTPISHPVLTFTPFKNLNEELLFPWIATVLQQYPYPLDTTAILIKDRYQADRLKKYLLSLSIPATSFSKIPLRDLPSFTLLKAYVKALRSPQDLHYLRRFLLLKEGLSGLNELIVAKEMVNLQKALISIQEKGLYSLFTFIQVDELLPIFFKEHLLTLEDLQRKIDQLQTLDAEEVLDLRKPVGVNILTTHASKGLEFNLVIPLGIATPDNLDPDEEEEKEKMRLLYVALTRAKEALVIPYFENATSPLNRLIEQIGPTLFDLNHAEILIAPPHIDPKPFPLASIEEIALPPFSFKKELVYESFSSLYQPAFVTSYPKLEPSLPLGVETGLFFHRLFEMIFKKGLHTLDSLSQIEKLIQQQTLFSPLQGKEGFILEKLLFALETPFFHQRSLKELSKERFFAEMPFHYPNEKRAMKGFIDLCYIDEKRIGIFDWKLTFTEGLPIEEVMRSHCYHEQASIYRKALEQIASKEQTIDVYYLFLRDEVIYVC